MKPSERHAVAAAAVALVLGAEPARAGQEDWPFQPVPIGAGPEYQPAARWPLAGVAGFGGLRGGIHEGARMHLELFAHQQVIVVPGGIGVSGGRTTLYGNVVDALWHAPAWTLEPGGVVHIGRDGLRLGDLFAIWGQPVGEHRLLSFRGRVRAWVNGKPRPGDPASIALRDRDQVVLVLGGDVDIHPSFTFKPVRR
jgi:hypothetical protein